MKTHKLFFSKPNFFKVRMNNTLQWDVVPSALGYVLDVNEKIVDIAPDILSLLKVESRGLLILAVGRNGLLVVKGTCYL